MNAVMCICKCMCVVFKCVHTVHCINPQLTCFESLLAEGDRVHWASACHCAAISCHVGAKCPELLPADCSTTNTRQQDPKQL